MLKKSWGPKTLPYLATIRFEALKIYYKEQHNAIKLAKLHRQVI